MTKYSFVAEVALKNTEKIWAYLWNFTVFCIYSIIIIVVVVKKPVSLQPSS